MNCFRKTLLKPASHKKLRKITCDIYNKPSLSEEDLNVLYKILPELNDEELNERFHTKMVAETERIIDCINRLNKSYSFEYDYKMYYNELKQLYLFFVRFYHKNPSECYSFVKYIDTPHTDSSSCSCYFEDYVDEITDENYYVDAMEMVSSK